jgi:hypothetical protein
MKTSIIGCVALCASLVACPDPKPAVPTSLEIVRTALERQGKTPHYRIDATLSSGGEVLQYMLDCIAPDKTYDRSALSEAITIGATYYDRFMGGPWNVSSVGVKTPPATSDTFDPIDVSSVLFLGKGKLNAEPCDRYVVGIKSNPVDGHFCIDLVGLLPLIVEFDDAAQGNVVQKFDYDVAFTITAPV